MPGSRLVWLDAARGIAALGVVMWHWQHMYGVSGWPLAGFDRSAQPFYAIAFPLYEGGSYGVDLFFILSGFIFFRGYLQAVEDKTETAAHFAWWRFSRLWPLHIAALLSVAVMQHVFHALTNRDFIYGANDLKHFVLHLGLVQNWPTETLAFNGPTWSVSVEIFLYLSFFVLARLKMLRHWGVLLAIIAFGELIVARDWQFGRGLIGFYMGGLVYHLSARFHLESRAAMRLFFGALIGWATAIAQLRLDLLPAQLAPKLFTFGLLPLTVFCLATADRLFPTDSKTFHFLGKISYSSYLLHFPLQLAMATVAVAFGIGVDAITGPVALAGFMGALLLVSWASYRFLELPSQDYLRAAYRRAAHGMRRAVASG